MTPLVSVICITYNHEKYIRRCLDGFVMQRTTFPFEVLVHDDASTDNTPEIVKEYAEKYPDIIKPILQNENQYSQGKRITPLLCPLIFGKYVAICEGDDYWCDEHKLQMQYEAMESDPSIKMCVHKVENVDEGGKTLNTFYPQCNLQSGIIKGEEFVKLCTSDYFQTSSYFFRAKEYIEYIQDLPEFAKVSPVGDSAYLLYFGYISDVFFIDSVMSCYRNNSNTSMMKNNMSSKENRISFFSRVVRMYEEYDTYTEYHFHDICVSSIDLFSYMVLMEKQDYKEVLKNRYKKLFQKELLRTKIRIYLFAFFPCLKRLYYRIKS